MRLMILGIKNAFLYEDIKEKISVDVPGEDRRKAKEFCGSLCNAMYGTRAAPVVWQKVVKATMGRVGFTGSVKFPCVYFEERTGLKAFAHVSLTLED